MSRGKKPQKKLKPRGSAEQCRTQQNGQDNPTRTELKTGYKCTRNDLQNRQVKQDNSETLVVLNKGRKTQEVQVTKQEKTF